jgi:hypothetical protein
MLYTLREVSAGEDLLVNYATREPIDLTADD